MRILASIAREQKHPPAARIAACVVLHDRGWGKPVEPHEDGGNFRVTIREINGDDKPLRVDGPDQFAVKRLAAK